MKVAIVLFFFIFSVNGYACQVDNSSMSMINILKASELPQKIIIEEVAYILESDICVATVLTEQVIDLNFSTFKVWAAKILDRTDFNEISKNQIVGLLAGIY